MKTVFLYLFFPFLLYIVWGPVAFFFTARAVVKLLSKRYGPQETIGRALVILLLLFLPVAVTSPGGNIPVVLPWWLAVVGMWLPLEAGVEFSVGSFIVAVLAIPLAYGIVAREVRRQRPEAKPAGGP